MPVLPNFLKHRLKPKHISWIPKFLARFIATIFDLYSGFKYGNPEIGAYAKHNIFHIFL